jgi:glycosyltransferase involved in cell wall biosynthesis
LRKEYLLKPGISIIIPVYNTEKTLKRCLDSVFAQDFHSYEVILVNDGSTDRTLEVAKTYERYSNFVLIDQPNAGTARARWRGITGSDSDYLAFVDADDYIAPDMMSKMYQKVIETEADVVICGVKRVNGRTNLYRRYKEGSETGIWATEKVMKGIINGSLWNKLFIRDLFFDEDYRKTIGIKYGQDQLLLAPTIARAQKVAYLEEILYFYVQNPVSATNRPKVSALADLLKVRSFLFEFYKSPRFSEWNHLAPYYYAIGLIDILRILSRAEKQQEACDLRANILTKLYDIPGSGIWRAKRSGVFFDIMLLRAGLFETFYSVWESDLFRPVRELRLKLSQKA